MLGLNERIKLWLDETRNQDTYMSDTIKTDRSPWVVFLIFLRLGLTSFGGPIAHLGYFRDEFVIRRQWLTERSYTDLVALCQFLPGPASSQVGIALWLSRSGYAGVSISVQYFPPVSVQKFPVC
jgi:chromate transport protein ChrA